MEPRSPFHHHHHPQHPGYISLPPPPPRPPPPNPHDRSLYHQPHRLPPPPPLPPGLHPLYHHPDFHHQQNPRKPHTPSFEHRDRNRPNRFNHPHQYHEEQHVRREVWDNPTRQIHQQNHPIVVFDPQHEHPHREHLHHHQNQSTLVAIDRFEDLDDRDHSDLEVVQLPEGFEVEDLYLPPPDKGYRGNNSNSRNNNNVYYSNNPRNVLIDSELDSGDFHIVSDERRVDYERKVASLGRNRSVSHNSIMEIENEGLGWEYEVRDDRVRNVSDKRARIGKYKDVVESEGYKEFVRPPHKKVQRPSALHRVQLEKDNYRNWKNDENEYFDDPNDGGFSNRGPIVFSDQRQEEVREYGGRGRSRLFPSQRQEQEREFSGKRPMGYSNPIQEEVREASSVELDVSFKSNTLVAKAVVSSSNQNPMVSSDGASTPNSKKRKAIVPLLSVSSPRVTAIRERPLNASKKNWNATSSFEKVFIQSKDKATYGTQSGVAVGSQSRPNVTSTRVPTEQSKPKAARTITGNGVSVKSQPGRDGESISTPLQKSGVVKSPLSALVGSNKPCANKIKKKVVKKVKKKVVPVSGSPSAPVTKVQEGVANGSNTGADSTLNSSKTLAKSEEKVQVAISGTMDDACSQPCENVLDASVVKRAAVRPAVCSDGISIPKVGKMNGVPPSTNLSGSKITKPLNASSVVDDKNSDLSTDMGAGKSDGEGAVSSSGTKAGAGSQSLDGANAPHNDSATLKSPLNHVGSSGEMVHSCLSGFENSREMYQRPVNADNLNSDKDIKQSEEQVPSSGSDTKDGVHLQSLDSVIEPVKNTAAAVVESFQCPLVSSVDTPPVKKKSVMDRLSGFSSSRAIKERPIHADGSARYEDPALSSDKGLRQFEQKSAPSGAHTVDNVGSQSLNGKTVAPEESEAVQSQFSPLVGSPGTSNIKKKKPKRKKKKFMNNLSGDSSSRVTNVNERSEKEGTVSVITTTNAVALPVVTVPVEKSAVVESFPKHGFGSPEKPKVEKKEKVTKVSVTSSSRVSAIHEKPANADGQTHGVGGALSLDRDLKQSEDEVTTSAMQTIDDDVSQFLHEVSLSLQKQSKVGSVSGSAIDSCAMDKINEKPFPGLSSLKPYEIHERMVNADSLVHGSDTPLTSDKDLSQSEAEVKASLIKGSAVRPSPIYLDDCVGTYAKINKKQNSITPPSSQLTKMSDEPLKSDTLNDNMDITMDAAASFDEGQKKSEIKAMVSGIGNLDDVCSQPLDWAPVSQNSQQERPPAVTDVVRDGLDDGIVRSSMHSYVDPISIFEDSTSRDLLSRYMGLEDNQRDDSSFTMVTDSPMYVPFDETIEQESEVTREGQTDVYGAEEHGRLGQEDLEDVGLHSQMQEESNNNSDLELYNPILNEKPPGELVKDSLPVISNPSSSVAKPLLSSLTNHNKEAMDSIPESHVTADPRQSSFTVPEVHIMNSEQSHCQLPSKKDGKGNRSNNESLDQTLHDHLNPEKLSLASKQSGQPISGLKPEVGVSSVKKAFQVTPVPKPLPGRAPFASGKGPDSVTHVTRPRTWRRMDNRFPLSRQEFGLSTGPSQRQSPKKFEKIQSTSYVRKGNSLVRNYAPTANPNGSGVASTSLNHMVRDESRQSAVSGDELNCVEPRNGSGTGVERFRASPLPRNTSPPNGTTSSSQANTSSTSADLLAEDCSESTPDPACDKPGNQDAGHSDQDGVSDKPETPSTLDSGKPKSSTINGITYVKPKSNQLVVSCNTVGVSENIQPLHSSASYDQYYKKKNNQLIRNSPSLGSYLKQASSVLVDSSNAESQRDLKVSSMKCSRNPNKRSDKALVKNSSMVWTLNGTQNQNKDTNLLHRGKVFPHLFPWKRISHWRNSISNLASVSQRSPFSLISKKLLLSRKRDTVYTRSTGGFSLRKAKVLSIGGSNLKWSKSIESRSKKANEEATLAVAAVEKKKRERKGAGHAIASAKNKSRSSRERIFRIGSVRYKMDPSKRTLQRIPDENPSSAVDAQSGKDLKRSFIPKRLLIGNDEYVRIGNGNQLVRDPKKLVRILASEKVRWSLHTARLRMAKKQQYCQFFTRFGKCNKSNGKCPYIHDPEKIAVCTKFLKGSCSNTNCTLTHKVIPERMEDCSYFLQGLCTKEKCPYRHVNVNPNAPVCEGFLRGYCADGNECCKKHTYACPQFESTGECPQRPMCKLRHPKNQNRSRKRKRSKDRKSVAGRYFGSRLTDSYQMGFISSNKHSNVQNEDIFSHEGRLTNYISLDASDAEIEDTDDPVTKFDDSELSDVQSDELDKLMKPLRLMNRTSSLWILSATSQACSEELA